ncbi:MAG: LD-carboxypeptidase [Bacteroidales bacterium]|nr:LD-carboxypeptidase [Bacteroidales bacterium]
MKIAIAAPARWITPADVECAIQWLKANDFEPVYDDRLFAQDYIFAGSDDFRAAVIQEYMDRDDIDVIWLARGGYGSIRIIDKLDFTYFVKHPKVFVGFSDTTVFHGKMQRLGIPSIHGPLAGYFDRRTAESKLSLYDALMGKPLHYEWATHPLNKLGSVKGEMVGGNLSVLYGMMGSNSFPETDGNILFIEEVDEYIYHVERMMYGLKRAGKLDHLKALIVGGLTEIHDNPDPFGKTVEQAIFDVVKDYDYPICFGFPSGHQPDNRAIVLGKTVELSASNDGCHFLQLLH